MALLKGGHGQLARHHSRPKTVARLAKAAHDDSGIQCAPDGRLAGAGTVDPGQKSWPCQCARGGVTSEGLVPRHFPMLPLHLCLRRGGVLVSNNVTPVHHQVARQVVARVKDRSACHCICLYSCRDLRSEGVGRGSSSRTMPRLPYLRRVEHVCVALDVLKGSASKSRSPHQRHHLVIDCRIHFAPIHEQKGGLVAASSGFAHFGQPPTLAHLWSRYPAAAKQLAAALRQVGSARTHEWA